VPSRMLIMSTRTPRAAVCYRERWSHYTATSWTPALTANGRKGGRKRKAKVNLTTALSHSQPHPTAGNTQEKLVPPQESLARGQVGQRNERNNTQARQKTSTCVPKDTCTERNAHRTKKGTHRKHTSTQGPTLGSHRTHHSPRSGARVMFKTISPGLSGSESGRTPTKG
jgi:hypothetical protein